MLDIKFVREHKDIVKASEKKRGHDQKMVDTVLSLDEAWKKEVKKMEKRF